MAGKTDDITLAPIDRSKLMDDSHKLGTVLFTKEEKLLLTKLVGTKTWDVIKNIYLKQRAVQIATTSINFSTTLEHLEFYRGMAAENKYFVDNLEKIVADFKKEQEKK